MEEDRGTEKYLQICEKERALAESKGRLEEYLDEELDLYESTCMREYFSCRSDRDRMIENAQRCPFCHECNNTLSVLA
jgi:hypothetical protein